MISSIKNGVVVFSLVTIFTSCNQGESLQSYYVNNQEKPNFLQVDVPVSMVKLAEEQMNEEQKEAYRSIDKLNMLAYSVTQDEADYKLEQEKVTKILQNEKYEELMRGSMDGGKFVVKMIGDDDLIDELIVFGSSSDKGFAIIRVLGDDMDPVKIMKLGDVLQNIDADQTDVKNFIDFFQ